MLSKFLEESTRPFPRQTPSFVSSFAMMTCGTVACKYSLIDFSSTIEQLFFIEKHHLYSGQLVVSIDIFHDLCNLGFSVDLFGPDT